MLISFFGDLPDSVPLVQKESHPTALAFTSQLIDVMKHGSQAMYHNGVSRPSFHVFKFVCGIFEVVIADAGRRTGSEQLQTRDTVNKQEENRLHRSKAKLAKHVLQATIEYV